MTSSLTKSSGLAVRVDSEACWEANNTALKTGSVRTDLRLLDGSDLNVERTLADWLSAVGDCDDVLAGLLRFVDTFSCELVDLSDAHPLFHTTRPEHLDDEFALTGTLRVHAEVCVITDTHTLRLDTAPCCVTLLGIHRCKWSTLYRCSSMLLIY